MTAAHEQRNESAKLAARLRSLADVVGAPVTAGKNGRQTLKPRQRNEWAKITDQVVHVEQILNYGQLASMTSNRLAIYWKNSCTSSGIGVGWFASWVFWNWAFPMLVELAKLWIEAQRNADTQQGPVGER
jgi:hypothetical protein